MEFNERKSKGSNLNQIMRENLETKVTNTPF